MPMSNRGSTRQRVWKVTAEQADWNRCYIRIRGRDREFGRLPPNRRIGTAQRCFLPFAASSLEGYRRTGGLEHKKVGEKYGIERVWKVTAEQADWNL